MEAVGGECEMSRILPHPPADVVVSMMCCGVRPCEGGWIINPPLMSAGGHISALNFIFDKNCQNEVVFLTHTTQLR